MLAVGPKWRAEVPVCFLAYDLLEDLGEDLRSVPAHERRQRLKERLDSSDIPDERIAVSPLVHGDTRDELARQRAAARERGVEGLMLKRRGSAYTAGRPCGDWWRWKVDPFSIDTVLVYAQRGHG